MSSPNETLSAALLAFSESYQAAFDAALAEMVEVGPGHKEGRNLARAILRDWEENLEKVCQATTGLSNYAIISTFQVSIKPRLEEELAHVYEHGTRIDWSEHE